MLSYADKLQPEILNSFAAKKRDLFLRNHNFMDVPYLLSADSSADLAAVGQRPDKIDDQLRAG
jgi:hypothetical protein